MEFYLFIIVAYVSPDRSFLYKNQIAKRGCRGRDRMVVGFSTTCAISAYRH